jgi:hypothetical protein
MKTNTISVISVRIRSVFIPRQEAVLPVEVNLNAYRFAKQNNLSAVMYHDLMMDNINEVTDKRLVALNEMEKEKFELLELITRK